MSSQATNTSTELKQKLAKRIDEARAKLDVMRADIARLHEEDMDSLARKREEIDKRLTEQKQHAQDMMSDIASWKKEKVAHTQDAIGAWRKRRELQKLQDRAEKAEDYALKLVSVAAIDFEEAEQAVLDALAARFDAEMASSTTA